jgi:hypothetical protein
MAELLAIGDERNDSVCGETRCSAQCFKPGSAIAFAAGPLGTTIVVPGEEKLREFSETLWKQRRFHSAVQA